MQLDQPTLQQIFNVAVITGVTSSAVICHLLRRDNQALTAELVVLREQVRNQSKIAAEPAESPASTPTQAAITVEQPSPGSVPAAAPAAVQEVPPAAPHDIRQYVARRAQNWMVPPAPTLQS